jgi:hypothetical protein
VITGSYEVDGERHDIAVVTPASFEVTCRHVEFSILKDTQPGEMSVTVVAGGAGSARTTAGPNESIECGFEKTWGFGGTSVWAHLVAAGAS